MTSLWAINFNLTAFYYTTLFSLVAQAAAMKNPHLLMTGPWRGPCRPPLNKSTCWACWGAPVQFYAIFLVFVHPTCPRLLGTYRGHLSLSVFHEQAFCVEVARRNGNVHSRTSHTMMTNTVLKRCMACLSACRYCVRSCQFALIWHNKDKQTNRPCTVSAQCSSSLCGLSLNGRCRFHGSSESTYVTNCNIVNMFNQERKQDCPN